MIATPLVLASRFAILLANLVGSWICHQLPERSLWIAGMQLPVCARCTGIYAGAALGWLARGKWRRNWMFLALGIVALDWSSEALGLRPAWAPVRVLTGAMLGYAAAPAVGDAVREWRHE